MGMTEFIKNFEVIYSKLFLHIKKNQLFATTPEVREIEVVEPKF